MILLPRYCTAFASRPSALSAAASAATEDTANAIADAFAGYTSTTRSNAESSSSAAIASVSDCFGSVSTACSSRGACSNAGLAGRCSTERPYC